MSIFSRIKTAAASTSGTNPFNRVKEIVRAIKFSASPRLYGRFSSGAGEGEEIRIGSGLSIINGELVASATNTINSSTASDGTANISVLTLDVVGTLTANHIHGNLAGAVYTHVRAGENLAKGDPVYVSGFHGSGSTLIPIVSKADASNPAKMPAIGVMDAAVANNANGHMVITGTITEFNTNAYSLNAELYVANGGGLTATPPTNSQAVARVERANANNGAIIVKIGELATSASTANTLVRRGANGEASFSRVRVTAVGGADAVTALSATGVGVSGSGGAAGIYGAGLGSGAGLYGDSEAGVGMQSTSQTGTNHAEFGDNANNRSFIRRVLGLIGWWRGSFTQTLGAPSVLTANRAVTLPDADGIVFIRASSIPSTPTSTGVVGQIAADSSFFYICTATNTWRRVALTTW
jgi:hypothetical protein